jgi:TPR repeat protein
MISIVYYLITAGMYMYENSVHDNDEKVVHWFTLAGINGSANAQCILGCIYKLGEMVEKNEHLTYTWWRKAAEQNDPDANFEMGRVCFKGEIVEKITRWP